MIAIMDGYKDFIKNMFLELLEREVDKAAAEFYQKKLTTEEMGIDEFINTLLNSDEYQSIKKKRPNKNVFLEWAPPGHFYSPIPEIEDIKRNKKKLFNFTGASIPGVNINKEKQLNMLSIFSKFYDDLPFTETKSKTNRYYYNNDFFTYTDAIILYSMIRHLKPQNIIEVGSGFSSAVILDTNESFFGNSISCQFIEPYPDRLLSLIHNNESAMLVQDKLENIDLAIFERLSANDILFIDSSHVSKIGSDVNYLFFEIIPRLKQGVYIHIHDIFYPFEYPPQWVYEGRSWNEAYILKTFMQFNDSFEIIFWNDYMGRIQGDQLFNRLPLSSKNTGTSFWMHKTK